MATPDNGTSLPTAMASSSFEIGGIEQVPLVPQGAPVVMTSRDRSFTFVVVGHLLSPHQQPRILGQVAVPYGSPAAEIRSTYRVRGHVWRIRTALEEFCIALRAGLIGAWRETK